MRQRGLPAVAQKRDPPVADGGGTPSLPAVARADGDGTPGFAQPPRHAESALFEVSCVENDTTFPHSKQVGSLKIEVLRAVRMWMRGGHVRPSGIVSRKTRCVAGQNYQIVGTGYCGIILSSVIIVILPICA